MNGDGINNVLDVVSLVNCVLGDGCEICAGDMNQDGVLNVLDVVEGILRLIQEHLTSLALRVIWSSC